MTKIDGQRILVAESRELDLLASMLESEGAVVLRCPLVQILDLEDRSAADIWIDECIAHPFDDLILLTGEGLRKLVSLSGPRKDKFIAALAKTRTVIRGPKPARALREIGLSPGKTAPEPTSKGVLIAFAQEDLKGRRIGVQIYPGDGSNALLTSLREKGAMVFPVLPYRYASDSESARVAQAIRDMAMGSVDMIAFTSSPQVERLFAIAKDYGLEKELAQGLSRLRIVSIGPVVSDTLKSYGFSPSIQPADNFHLKPMIKAILSA